MILIHKICIAFSGLGSFRNVDIVIKEIAAMLLKNEKQDKNISASELYECLLTENVAKVFLRFDLHFRLHH